MKRGESEPAQNDSVSLKPVFGIPPETYVPALLGSAILLLLLLLLLVPGIRNNGSLVTFTSVPEGATVYVDGVRRGATPVEVFVERGRRSVTLRRPFFTDAKLEIEVGGRLIGSALFPRRQEVRHSLDVADATALTTEAARQFNRWSLIGEANAQYQFAPVLSEAALDLTAAGEPRLLNRLLTHALRDVHTTALLKDYLRATALSEGAARAFTGVQALELLGTLARRIDEDPALAYLAASALPEETAPELRDSAWYERITGDMVTRMLAATRESEPAPEEPPPRIELEGETFVEIPATTFVMGPQTAAADTSGRAIERPHVASVDRFFIMETEVTRRLFRRFVGAVPRWDPSNRTELTAAGLADANYLRDWSDGTGVDQSTRPVRFVSYHAAQAFCEWMTDRLPPALSGFEVRLPTEAEWEWAATLNAAAGYDAVFADAAMSTPLPVGSSEPGSLGVYDLLGNVWEWTGNWYHPADYLVGGAAAYPGTQRVVRGGSWANDRRSIGVTTRGAQPPEWSTAFLGFRPVLAEAQP